MTCDKYKTLIPCSNPRSAHACESMTKWNVHASGFARYDHMYADESQTKKENGRVIFWAWQWQKWNYCSYDIIQQEPTKKYNLVTQKVHIIRYVIINEA